MSRPHSNTYPETQKPKAIVNDMTRSHSEESPSQPMSPPLSPNISPTEESDVVEEGSDHDKLPAVAAPTTTATEKESDGTMTPTMKQQSIKQYSEETDSTGPLAAHTDSISDKRNHEFHTLFKSIPEEEGLVEDYGCALQKEILVQGRLYITDTHLCFNANIFGWVTNFVIAFTDIVSMEKRTTAIFIPNAIQISTTDDKYLFASFLSRDQAFDLIMDIWKYDQWVADHSSDTDSSSSGMISDDEETFSEEEESDVDVKAKNAPLPKSPPSAPKQQQKQPSDTKQETVPPPKSTKQVKEKTECTCGNDHYPNTVMDQVYDGTLEAMYSLLYTCGFMKKFLTEDEELSDVVIGEWKASEDNQHTRSTSYIKPLNGAIGPKQTQCLQTEKTLHYDLSSSVTMLTTTQTPDVPSGSSFEVKTRTCMTWAGTAKVRILVTVLVDFSKTSWIKSTIEKASVDGQVSFYQDLNTAIRHYIKQHPSEFCLDGKHFKGKPKKRRPRKHHHQPSTTSKAADGTTEQKEGWGIWLWNQTQGLVSTITATHLILVCLILLVAIQFYMAIHPSPIMVSCPSHDNLLHWMDDKFKGLDTMDDRLKALESIDAKSRHMKSQRTWHTHS